MSSTVIIQLHSFILKKHTRRTHTLLFTIVQARTHTHSFANPRAPCMVLFALFPYFSLHRGRSSHCSLLTPQSRGRPAWGCGGDTDGDVQEAQAQQKRILQGSCCAPLPARMLCGMVVNLMLRDQNCKLTTAAWGSVVLDTTANTHGRTHNTRSATQDYFTMDTLLYTHKHIHTRAHKCIHTHWPKSRTGGRGDLFTLSTPHARAHTLTDKRRTQTERVRKSPKYARGSSPRGNYYLQRDNKMETSSRCFSFFCPLTL